jgi:hypothetical protein
MAQRLQRIKLLIIVLGATAHASFSDLAQPFRTVARCLDLRASTRNDPAPIQCLESIHLMRDINPHLAFSVSFLTGPKKHPLYARPWKQWRLAGGEEEGKDVKT